MYAYELSYAYIKCTSTKKLWNCLNPYLNPNKRSIISSSDLLDHPSDNKDQDCANLFSNFFSSILNLFTFLSFLTCTNYITNFFNTNPILSTFRTTKPQFHFSKISPNTTFKHLLKLDPKSAPGICGIESEIFVYCANVLAIPLTNLFNVCIESNCVPDEWKISYITPIYKGKGSKSSPDNYRPISVLPPIDKIFEAIIGDQIRNFFESNEMLSDSQFGFRNFRSCELALNSMINSWKLSLDIKHNVIAILLDFSKAFDTVDHSLLLKKFDVCPKTLL